MQEYELVIRGARVIDGTSSPAREADVAVNGDRIVRVGTVTGRGAAELDATGLCLTPGFVDVHSHDDFVALFAPQLPFKVLQGVTSEVVGNCGIGAAPRAGAQQWVERLHPGRRLPHYSSYADYVRALQDAGPSINLAVLAGHGALRSAVAPHSEGPLTARERKDIEVELDLALQAGVIGLSTGLIYDPGRHASQAELRPLCRQLNDAAAVYATHLRDEGDELLGAVDEAIELGKESGASVQLSHHKAHGRKNWGRVRQSLQRVEAARQGGCDVWGDQYPYTAGSTILQALVEKMGGRSRLDDIPASDVVVSSVRGHPKLSGSSLSELQAQWSCSKEEATSELLSLDPGTWVLIFAMSEDDVKRVMRHPAIMFGSDGLPTDGRPHPRLWGTFPRILGRYVRQESVLSLESAVHKMTALPARRFGLAQRGQVRKGFFADLVLFDPDRVAAGSSYMEPDRPPVGIHSVWVNGDWTVRDGLCTGVRSGRYLPRA